MRFRRELPRCVCQPASLPEKAKAYGVYCQDQSKKHVKGVKGTSFSRCVVAAAQVKREALRG